MAQCDVQIVRHRPLHVLPDAVSRRRCDVLTTSRVLVLLTFAVTVPSVGTQFSIADVPTWTEWEHVLSSDSSYTNPYQQVTLTVTYAAPDGRSFRAYGFWDGGDTFRIRFMFPMAGTWTWRTQCNDAGNEGLHNRSGSVEVHDYRGGNPLYRKGYLRISANRRYLTHGNGEPFLWLGDTAWSAFMSATQSEWERYVGNRAAHRFNVIQVHCGGAWAWVRRHSDREGNTPFLGTGTSFRWNPAYWQQIDSKIRCANEHGMLVYICAVRQPGPEFPEDSETQLRVFSRSLAARYMGNFVLYSPTADDVHTWQADVVGHALDEADTMHLTSAHPRFYLEPAVAFHDKAYIDVAGLQSGEGWMHNPYKKERRKPFSPSLAARNAVTFPLSLYRRDPVKPVINQEGPYDHPPWVEDGVVRHPLPPHKAAYWSFLSGASGFTYGCFGIWNWGIPVKWMPTYDYEVALHRPSADYMRYMSDFFGAMPWWTLEPRHELVQRNSKDPLLRMVLAKSPAGDLAVAYLPDNAEIVIDMESFPAPMKAKWFHPTESEYRTVPGKVQARGTHTFVRPAEWQEALLILTRSAD